MSTMPMTVWVLVCDATRAMFFQVRDAEAPWHLVNVVSHPEATGEAAESDRELERQRFAHSLVETLDRALRAARFRRWVLVAPPHFGDLVKKVLTQDVERFLMATVDKDLVHMSMHLMTETLRDAVRIPADQRDAVREAYRQTP